MPAKNPFTEEGRTRIRNFERRLGGYLLLSAVVGVAVGFGFFRLWTRAHLQPLQKLYLTQYGLGSLKALVSERAASKYLILTSPAPAAGGGKAVGGVTDAQVYPIRDAEGRPVRNTSGYLFAWNPPGRGELTWQRVIVNDRHMVGLLREYTYEGSSLFALFLPSLIAGAVVFGFVIGGLVIYDRNLNRKYEKGVFVRGTQIVEPEKYELKSGQPGLGTPSLRMGKPGLIERFRAPKEEMFWLRVPREEEAAHATLLGDTGTGKSQLIHIFLWQMAQRRPAEPVIVYDPAGEFLAAHLRAERGDIVLNPLDARFPFWSPTSEVRLMTDRDLIAESFFPGSEGQRGTSEFFLKASRSVFAQLLEFNPTPGELIAWLSDEDAIDSRMEGTEHVHLIDKSAPQQRSGVLGTLSEVGKQLKLLPWEEICSGQISFTDWAQKRQGWIFVTSTQDTRSQLRGIQAIFLDLLMKRLMACDPAWGASHPCWLIVDEAHALGRLPALYTALTEGRKFGIKLILGTQNKNQFEEKYGRGAATMLAAPVLKIVFRCNEPDSARWVSELIGEAEWEKPKLGVTASVEDQGRDSVHYSNQAERKPVISREEIMALPKLQGFWKYQDTVAPFKFQARNWPRRADRFQPRREMIAKPPNKQIEAPATAQPGAVEARKRAAEIEGPKLIAIDAGANPKPVSEPIEIKRSRGVVESFKPQGAIEAADKEKKEASPAPDPVEAAAKVREKTEAPPTPESIEEAAAETDKTAEPLTPEAVREVRESGEVVENYRLPGEPAAPAAEAVEKIQVVDEEAPAASFRKAI